MKNDKDSRKKTKWADRLSFQYLKREILKTTYGTHPTFLSLLDPRVLFVWYLFFALAPWFSFDPVVLGGYIIITASVAAFSRVSGLIIFFLGFGVITQLLGLALTTLAFGGDFSVFSALSLLVLKLIAVSLASIAAFSSLDPERLGDGLATMGLPNQVVFGISYGYRIIPVLIDEYNSIFNAYRMRSRGPQKGSFRWIKKAFYFLAILMKSFYPMLLNTAKRTRTTVESLELRGFSYSYTHPEVSKIRLSYLGFTTNDGLFLAANIALLGFINLGAKLLS